MTFTLALRRSFGLRFSSAGKSQRFHCRYRVAIRNRAGNPVRFFVLYPVPPKLPYQSVAGITFAPADAKVWQEGKFGNRYVALPVTIPGGQSVQAGLSAIVTVLPRTQPVRYASDYGADVSLPGSQSIAVTPQIQQLAENLCGRLTDTMAITQRLYDYVVTRLHYGNPITGLYTSTDAMSLPDVDCGGFCSLLAALLTARGIASRLLFGFWADLPSGEMHAWLEARLPDGRWIAMDPAVDHLARRGRSRKLSWFGFVGSDRIAFSIGTDLALLVSDGTVSAALLQHPLVVPPQPPEVALTLTVASQRI